MRKFTARKTCDPSPEHSLFKYILNYMPGKQDGTKNIPRLVYSYDYGSERLKFMPSPHPVLKTQYVAFIDQLSQMMNDTIVDFFANCYPQLTQDKSVILWYSHNLEMQEIHKTIQSNQALIDEVTKIASSCGFKLTRANMQQYGVSPLASMTPKFYPTVDRFNGMTKCLDYFIKKYSNQGLMSIEIYDNRMLRSDNLISKVAVNNFMSQEVEDSNPPQSIGTIINGRS